MHVRCPHCHNPIEFVHDSELADVECPSCGSSFNLLGEKTATFQKSQATHIGHFELVEQVGIGAFGSVWRAKDTELDRDVAVKIPRKAHLDSAEAEQFLREARSAAQLKHQNIVSVHEVGRDGGQTYIVSDFIEGLPLSSWLSGKQPTAREAAELCRTIAGALHHAHEAGVVHRDLKPSNIMLDAAGEPHIMDFGLAKRDAGEITMTVDGRVLGTPAYMSPEQARGEAHAADRRTDIYSLGVILFELLTGEKPFRGDYRMLIHQVLNEEAPGPRKLKTNVPRDLDTICLKCMEKQPEKRYASADIVAEELQRFISGRPIKARPISAGARAWRWSKRNPLAASLAVAGPIVTAIMALLYYQAHVERKRATAARDDAVRAQRSAELSSEAAIQARNEADAAKEEALRMRDVANETVDRYFTRVAENTLLNAPGMLELRRELLSEAQQHYERFAAQDADDPKLRSGKATAYYNLGRIAADNDQNSEAVDYFRRASEIQAGSDTLLREHGDTMNWLGVAYDRQSDFANSLDAYRQSGIIRRELAENARDSLPFDEQPASPERLDELLQLIRFEMKVANIAMNIGLVLKDMEPAEIEALTPDLQGLVANKSPMDFYRDATSIRNRQLEVLESLSHDNPEHEALRSRYGELCKDLAKGYFSKAQLEVRLKSPPAIFDDYFENAIKFYSLALEDTPNDMEMQFERAGCHRIYGESKYRSAPEAARSHFEAASSALRQLVYFNPGVSRYHKSLRGVGVALRNLGIISYEESVDTPEFSLDCFRAAEQVFSELDRQIPGEYRERLDDIREVTVRYRYYIRLRELIVAEQYDAIPAMADEFARENWEDGRTLNQIAWKMITEVPEQHRELRSALRIALRASEAYGHKNGHVLDTIAHIYNELGDVQQAVAWQTKAVKQLDDEGIQQNLQRYEAALRDRPETAASGETQP